MPDNSAAQRNLGIDLLRVVAMLMIVVLHLLERGALAVADGSPRAGVMMLMTSAVYCAVNCYALISGYVGLGTGVRYGRLVQLWLRAIAYSVAITLFFRLVMDDVVVPQDWYQALLPITTESMWYLTAYFGLFIFKPVLNSALQTLGRRELRTVIAGAFVFMMLLPCFVQAESLLPEPKPTGVLAYGLNQGYSTTWLAILYIIGGYIKKYGLADRVRPAAALMVYAAAVTAAWLLWLAGEDCLLSYTSPTVVLAAAALLLLFARLDVRWLPLRRVTALTAPCTLSVYIIHTHPLVWRLYLPRIAAGAASLSCAGAALYILAAALAIFTACTLADLVRSRIFALLRLDRASALADRWLSGGTDG